MNCLNAFNCGITITFFTVIFLSYLKKSLLKLVLCKIIHYLDKYEVSWFIMFLKVIWNRNNISWFSIKVKFWIIYKCKAFKVLFQQHLLQYKLNILLTTGFEFSLCKIQHFCKYNSHYCLQLCRVYLIFGMFCIQNLNNNHLHIIKKI